MRHTGEGKQTFSSAAQQRQLAESQGRRAGEEERETGGGEGKTKGTENSQTMQERVIRARMAMSLGPNLPCDMWGTSQCTVGTAPLRRANAILYSHFRKDMGL